MLSVVYKYICSDHCNCHFCGYVLFPVCVVFNVCVCYCMRSTC